MGDKASAVRADHALVKIHRLYPLSSSERGLAAGSMQVIDDLDAIIMRDGEPLEASITEGMTHPNIVNTIAHTVTNKGQKRCAPVCAPGTSAKVASHLQESADACTSQFLLIEFQQGLVKVMVADRAPVFQIGSVTANTRPATMLQVPPQLYCISCLTSCMLAGGSPNSSHSSQYLSPCPCDAPTAALSKY